MLTPSSIEVSRNNIPLATDSGQTSDVRKNEKPMSNKDKTSLNGSKINDRKELKSSVVKEARLYQKI